MSWLGPARIAETTALFPVSSPTRPLTLHGRSDKMLDKASGIDIGVVGLGPAVIPANRDESTSLVGRIPLRADERLGTSWVNGLPRDGSGLGDGS